MTRLEELGFSNLARMELFLWDLEIFLQIQRILKEQVVLKGGAAAQFYLPVENQRTSIDIDMLCSAETVRIQSTLEKIEEKFEGKGDFFKAHVYKPIAPKTDLPILTYYMTVPSVCTGKELFGKHAGVQEIKIEFHLTQGPSPTHSISSPSIFAVKTDLTYQILPLNDLFGDKLTTLGPNTIGIPWERADEIIKQIYDLASLIEYRWQEIDFTAVRKTFLARAKSEAKLRGLSIKTADIFSDISDQMKRISLIDFENDQAIVRLINNFQSLYLRKNLNQSPAQWAIIGSKISLMIDFLSRNIDGKDLFDRLNQQEREIEFRTITGTERGMIIRKFKEEFLQNFGSQGTYPSKILKGKNPTRILWMIITLENIEEVCSWIDKFSKGLK
jgi:hypothetical protein